MLQEAEYGLTADAMEGGAANARYKDDANLLVKFFKHPRLDNTKSIEAGRPIYVEVDYIQIMQPGNKDSIVIKPAGRLEINRFPEHWQKYQIRTSDDQIEGTMLEDWPGISRSLVEELKFFNIRTVEHLANMSDTNSAKFMGGNMLRQKAADYLEASAGNANAEALAAANARIDELMSAMEALKALAPQDEE